MPLRKSVICLALTLLFAANGIEAGVPMPVGFPGDWRLIGRTTIETKPNSVVLSGGFAVEQKQWGDVEMSFQARAPEHTEQVQVWAGLRCQDRDCRYVFALRGGPDNDLYFARYAPDGKMKFLGFAPLDFKPVPGTWYRLRVAAAGNRFQIYLNDEALPRINVVDTNAPWNTGGVLLGGGWLPVEYADLKVVPLEGEDAAAFAAVGDRHWAPPAEDKEALRKTQRATYQPARIDHFGPQRTEIAMDGNWLFQPDYALAAGSSPATPGFDDSSWHVVPVPEFWTLGLSWLHGETGFPDLEGVSRTKGVADSLYVLETQRADAYTFDWRRTKAAWYRHYLDLPSDLQGRHFDLTFAAIAKISEIWANGIKVGAHTGLFGQVECDVTAALKPGRNVIAVHVISEADAPVISPERVEGVAVTVEVTGQMLHSLPHGMLQGDVGGIWQPVKLTATSPVRVSDCFIQPGLHGAAIDLDIQNTDTLPADVGIGYSIASARDGAVLYTSQEERRIEVGAGQTGYARLATPHLNPKPWSPSDPNLYNLEIHLRRGKQVVDSKAVRFGFRTFTPEGGKFLLNGQPYWLRGANPFPNTLRPNDAALARRFMQLAHDGNVRATRSHIVPFSSTWLDAADEAGVAVSYEGTWPWLMLRGGPPSADLLQVWKSEFLSLMREHRNHPSLILWTVNNEMNFESNDANDPALLKKKWLILDDMIKAMRRTDPTRPIVADSNYARKKALKGYRSLVKPLGLDDGDVDDAHCYFGWYNETPFHLFDGEFGKRFSTPGRPLISQEMATGYPNEDDGHPTRFYLFKHLTPLAMAGDDAFENADPDIFLTRLAFLTKELAEALRRTDRTNAAGILHFAYFTWFSQPWSVDQIKPGPGYYALQTALQPVLVSAELYGRHFYGGSTVHTRVCIANDSENHDPLPASRLTWEVRSGGDLLSSGGTSVPPVKYYENRWLDVNFLMPSNLPTGRVNGQLKLALVAGGRSISENSYDIVLAGRKWADEGLDTLSEVVSVGVDIPGVSRVREDSIESVKKTDLLIVGGGGNLNGLREFVSGGGRALLLHPGASLAKLFPDEVRRFTAKEGEIVTMHVAESPVFSGIEPLDLAWFERGGRRVPTACTGVYQLAATARDATALASQCDIHGYLGNTTDIVKYTGSPLVEIRLGKGRLVASELCLEAGATDPIARHMLANLLRYLQ